MKKTLVALAVLGSFASVASAATSVTLYGRLDVGYDSFHHDGLKLQQDAIANQSRFGVKGEEEKSSTATQQVADKSTIDVDAKEKSKQ